MSIIGLNGDSLHNMMCRSTQEKRCFSDTSPFFYLKIVILIFSVIIPLSIMPAIAVLEWQKYLGGTGDEMANSIEQTWDGGYIVAGSTNSNNGDVIGNHGGYDAWVIKFDKNGDIRWQKCLGGSGNDFFNSIKEDRTDGYIAAGRSNSNNSDVIGNHEGVGFDFWVVKLNDTGAIQWQRCLGGSNDDQAFDIEPLEDGGYIVVGYTASNDGDVTGQHSGNCPFLPCTDVWVVKLSNKGDIQWQKCLGGSSWDAANSIRLADDGGFVVAGWTWSSDGNVSGYQGNGDIWVLKLDDVGDIKWQKCLGGSSSDIANYAQQTNDGGYAVVGYTASRDGNVSSNNDGRDVWLVKLNDTGSIQWQKCIGGMGEDYAYGANQTIDGGFIITGSTDSFNNGNQIYLIKVNYIGGKQWEETFGGSGPGSDSGYSVEQTSDGGYILAGVTYSFGNSSQLYMVKLFSTENHPPNDPSIPSGPNSGTTGTANSYSTSATDPDGDQVKYIFDWGDGTTTETNLVNSGTIADASHSWSDAGTYHIRAMAMDSKGASSNWSLKLRIQIQKPINSISRRINLELIKADGSTALGVGTGEATNNKKIILE
jgi:hypothetical protein